MKFAPFSVLLLAFTSLSSFAAPAGVFQAVLASEALKGATERNGQDIVSVKETALFRCPGCFRFEIVLGRGDSAKAVTFGTTGMIRNGQMEYNVAVVEKLVSDVSASAGTCQALGRVGGEDRACAQHETQTACEDKNHWEWCRWSAK